MMGDREKHQEVASLAQPAYILGFKRLAVVHSDYPAIIPSGDDPYSTVDSLILRLSTSQRIKLDNFEGESYVRKTILAYLKGDGRPVEADVYVWEGDGEMLSTEPWSLERFERGRLEDWLDLFEGMGFLGDGEDIN